MRFIVATLLFFPALATAQIAITAAPVPLQESAPSAVSVGTLTYLAGYHLASTDERFGGISGMDFAPKSGLLVAVSDRGFFIVMTLDHDKTGRLAGIQSAEISPILDPLGQPLGYKPGDAEEVAITPAGDVLVSFEHVHRVSRYGPAAGLSRAKEIAYINVPALANAPPNGGIEAFTVRADGTLIAFREKPNSSAGSFPAWLLTPRSSQDFIYVTDDSFQPTGAAILPGGDVLVLERRFSALTGVAARLVVAKQADIGSGKTVRTQVLAMFGGPVTCDNFEAVAVRPLPDGRTAAYVASDDNYRKVGQRTLLLQLALPAPAQSAP